MTTLRFKQTIEIQGINPYLRVSATQAAKLKAGWKRPMPVCVQINGQPETPWRINMMPAGDGSFYLYLAEVVRKASNTGVGDRVTAEVSFDAEYTRGPQGELPDWFAAALRKNSSAQQGWDALVPSRQKEILRNFARLKSVEAQQRNLEKAIHVLAGGKGRFMARAWNEGD